LKACEGRKQALEAELSELRAAKEQDWKSISREDIEESLKSLKETLSFATSPEVKSLLQEHIQEIRVPENGDALLEVNPRGLLSALRNFCMVTPRRHAPYGTEASRGKPFVRTPPPDIDMRFADSKYHRQHQH
jgi:hypothetical protein